MRNPATFPNRSLDSNQSQYSSFNSFHPKYWPTKKICTAIFAAWTIGVLLTWPLWVLIVNNILLLEKGLILILLPVIAVGIAGCFTLGWVQCYSFIRAFAGAMAAVIMGVSFAFYLGGILSSLLKAMGLPWYLVSGIISSEILVYASAIFILEIITDNALRPGRLRKLVMSTSAVTLFLIGIEILIIFTLGPTGLGYDGDHVMHLIKTALYGPIIWVVVVTAVSSDQ